MIVATTVDGIYDLDARAVALQGRNVGFCARSETESWALVDGTAVMRDAGDGWHEVAELERGSARVLRPQAVDDVLIGTTGAHVLRLRGAELRRLDAFDTVPGRDKWTNPAAGGRADVWTLARDGSSVFMSVHVGGLWRSDDEGETWTGVLEPDIDVHQVAAIDGLVVVAAAYGFGVTRDRGKSWSWMTDGLHASYLQSVALVGDTAYVGVSDGPFAHDAAVYRSAPAGAPFERRSSGLPDEFSAIGPHHLAADGDTLAVAEWSAQTVYVSTDAGKSWDPAPHEFPNVHTLVTA